MEVERLNKLYVFTLLFYGSRSFVQVICFHTVVLWIFSLICLMFLPLLDRYSCPDIYVLHTGLHGLWRPTNQRLLHLVCIANFNIYFTSLCEAYTYTYCRDWLKQWFLFCIRLGSNPEIAKQVSAEVVTKRETLTIADIFSYMTQESAKVKLKLNISYSFWNA